MQEILNKINDLENLLKINPNNSKAKLELKRLKTELEDRQSLIFTDEPEKQKINESEKVEKIESEELSLKTAHKIGTDTVFFVSEKLNERFKWDKATQTIIFDKGQTYTEEEILHFYQNELFDDRMLRCVHTIKTIFPQTRWVGFTIEHEPEITQSDDDELNGLFKDLKG